MCYRRETLLLCVCISLLALAPPTGSLAGMKVLLGRKWASNQQVSIDQIDHSTWSALLAKYVDARGNVDYAGWKASKADAQALDDYLGSLSRASLSVRSSREAKMAFWINAYNAVTIRGITVDSGVCCLLTANRRATRAAPS